MATLEFTRATPGNRVIDSLCTRSKSAMSDTTTRINENRLTPFEPEARKFLVTEMEKFFFGEGSAKPQGYVPE